MAFEWSANPAEPLVIDGVRLEYACHGPSPDDAPTIVMLHEGLGCTTLWRDFPQNVSERTGFGVFVFSRRGYGRSDAVELPRPVDYMTIEAVDVLPLVLGAIGFRRGVLLGHSDGATIAAIHAGSVSDMRVRGLVLMAPHFFTEPCGLTAIEAATRAYDSGNLRERLARHHADPDNAFRGWSDTWLNPEFQNWNVAEVIDYFRIPVLAIQGRDDQYGTLAQIEEIETRSYAPVDTAILDDCAHAPHLEQPQQTLDAVAEFCVRLERIEAADVVPV